MLLENTDLDGADEAQLDLFYLVDCVLEEIELATQATDEKKDKEDIDDCDMPAATPEFDTFDLMDEIDTTGQYTEPPFCPNSTSFNQKSAQVQQQFYQHSQLFNTSFDDITGNQHVVPEMDMDQFYDSIVNNQYQVSPNDKDILRTDCQYTTQDFYNHNVQDVIATPVNTEYIGNSEEDADLSFPEIPALTGRFPEVPKYMPESNVQSIPHHDESSNDGHHSDFKGWTRKHPDSWTRSDVLDWVFYCAEKISAEIGEDCSSLRAEKFSNLTGEALCRMGPEDFRLLEPMFGLSLYESFRKLLHEGVTFTHPPELTRDQSESDTSYTDTEMPSQHFSSLPVTEYHTVHSYVSNVTSGQSSSCTSPEMYPTYFPFDYGNPSIAVASPTSVEHQISHLYPNNMKSYDNYSTYSNYHYYQRHLQSDITSVRAKYENGITPIRRRPGRPRTKTIQTEEELQAQRAKKLKSQHLWEFIYELLNNPSYNPSVLKWENQANGVFRFVQSETVAQLWGNLKSNENMTYEKLSRAMRHYYKRGIMERVEGRRLVYKYSRATLDKMIQKHGFQT